MRKIRVAFFADILIEDFDGAARTMHQLIRRIPADRFEFLFVAGMGREEIRGYRCVLVPAMTIPVNRTYRMAVPQLARGRLRAELDAFEPDLVHIATPSLLGAYALRYGKARGLPVVSIYHTHFISYVDYYLRALPFLVRPVKRAIARGQKRFYNQVDVIYVPAESIAAEMRAIGVQGERMKIWKRGIDTSLFNPSKRDPALMERLTGNRLPTVMFTSRFVWEKNLETLIRIYRLARARSVACNFLMVGDGVARAACEQAMPGAVFYGNAPHEQLSVLYASSDVFLFPSISETYGNVVMEAMASGLPCVLADGGGARDSVSPGVTGFLCPPDDEAAYVDRIRLLLQDATLRRRFSTAGRQHSLGFDWQQLADTYFADVQHLVASR